MIVKMITGIAAAFAIIVGEAAATVAYAEDQPITRTELLRSDLADINGKETVIYVADLKPGAVGGKHTHFGDEFVYVLEGQLVVEPVSGADHPKMGMGKEPITLQAGDVGHLTPDVIHAARNGSESEMAKVLVILVVDKGKPLAEAAK